MGNVELSDTGGISTYKDVENICYKVSFYYMPKQPREKKSLFISDEWLVLPGDDKTIMIRTYHGSLGEMRVHISNEFSRSVLHIRIFCPCSVPKSKETAVWELMHRINRKLPAGHLEYDFESGTVSYRHSVSYAGITQCENDYADRLISNAIALTDIFFPMIKEFTNSRKNAGSTAFLTDRIIRRVNEYKIN